MTKIKSKRLQSDCGLFCKRGRFTNRPNNPQPFGQLPSKGAYKARVIVSLPFKGGGIAKQ